MTKPRQKISSNNKLYHLLTTLLLLISFPHDTTSSFEKLSSLPDDTDNPDDGSTSDDVNLLDADANNNFFIKDNDADTVLDDSDKSDDFVFSSCNAKLDIAPCALWSTWITSVITADKTVTIPCGTCISMDVTDGTTYNLPHGLDVAGRLVFPSEASVTVRTSFVFVQGVFEVSPPPSGTIVTDGDDTPTVRIRLIPSNKKDVLFYPDPDGDNRYRCGRDDDDGALPCNVGKMPFLVAGGRLDVRAMDEKGRCPAWTRLKAVSKDLSMIQLEDGNAAGCWGEGVELLVTSDVWSFNDQHVVTVKGLAKDGWLQLSEALLSSPTSLADDTNMAVEVALLSRTFILESEIRNRDQTGGHLMIMRTPTIKQTLSGILFRDFGQMGIKGRYPIHIHMSGDLPGTKISRNVIRGSRQRCIVIHASHNVTISDNVAYDNFGHCYFLEDGAEMDNTFERNLGALAKSLPKRSAFSREETDDTPAMFWIANPSNNLIGNVATGSQAQGFWWELRNKIRGPSRQFLPSHLSSLNPQLLPGGIIRDNVAHSNVQHGMTLYLHGWFPSDTTHWIRPKSYKNGLTGVFYHATRRMTLSGGFFSDNGAACIRNHFADDIVIENTTCIGESKYYNLNNAVESSSGLRSIYEMRPPCERSRDNILAGISFQPNEGEGVGLTLRNVHFGGFAPSRCRAGALWVEGIFVHDKLFDNYQTFSNVTIDDPSNGALSACDAVKQGVRNIAIEDPEGTMNPTGKPGFYVNDDPAITSFLSAPCTSTSSCLLYCPKACLRLVSFETNPSKANEGLNMMIYSPTQNVTQIIPRSVYYWTGVFDANERHTFFDETKDWITAWYGVALPPGEYHVSFVNEKTGKPVWPHYVREHFEAEPQCVKSLYDDATLSRSVRLGKYEFTYIYPDSDELGYCDNIITNGDFERGVPDGWQQHRANFTMVTPGADGSRYALATAKRSSPQGAWSWSVSQSLDISCLIPHPYRFFTFKGKFMLKDGNGNDASCTPGLSLRHSDSCPGLRMIRLKWDDGELVPRHRDFIGFLESYGNGTWYEFEFTVEMPRDIVNMNQVLIKIEGAPKKEFVLDDWSMKLLPTFQESLEKTTWTQINGRGRLAPLYPEVTASHRENFKALLDESPNKIIWRKCLSCQFTHIDVFYRRWTPIPEDMDLLHVLEESWTSENNCMGEDFNLYSTYEDAVADVNRWDYCNYDNEGLGIGFPRECGPKTWANKQWNQFNVTEGDDGNDADAAGKVDVAFVVEGEKMTASPSTTPTVAPTLSPSVGPSLDPTITPTMMPTEFPTMMPTDLPTMTPTTMPTFTPTFSPSSSPKINTVKETGTIAPTTTPETINLALSATAVQPCNLKRKSKADLAIDGNISSRLGQRPNLAMTCYRKNPWLLIDLKEKGSNDDVLNVVQTIKIICRSDASIVENLYVFIQDENKENLRKFQLRGECKQTVKVLRIAGEEPAARYIKLAMNHKHASLQIAEVEVMGYRRQPAAVAPSPAGSHIATAAATTTTTTPHPPLVNLALSGTATQKCTLNKFTASLAIDGKNNPNIRKGSVSSTCNTKSPWWSLDLGTNDDFVIHTIKVTCRSDRKVVRDIRIQLKDKSGKATDHSWHIKDYCYKETEVMTIPDGEEAVARYVTIERLSKKKSTIQLAEVEVMGYKKSEQRMIRVRRRLEEDMTEYMFEDLTENMFESPMDMFKTSMVNLAITGFATQSCTQEAYDANLAIDGNINNILEKGSVSSTCGKGRPTWWMVDLGAGTENRIGRILIYNRRRFYERLVNFAVQVLDDNEEIVWVSNKQQKAERTYKFIPPADTIGRFVRIIMRKQEFLQLAEVMVFGEALTTRAPTPTMINLAPNGIAEQACTIPPYDASLAIDGNINGDFRKASISSTCCDYEGEGGPWWIVDLGEGKETYVHTITVYNREDILAIRLNDFAVEVLDDDKNVLWSFQNVGRIGRQKDFLVNDGTVGRYVRIRMFRPVCLQLAEVQVWGYQTTIVTLSPTPDNMFNLATRGHAEQSCTLKEYRAKRAIDGNRNGDFEAGSVSSTCCDGKSPPWWKVTLPYGSEAFIHSITIYNRDDKGERLVDFMIEILDADGTVIWDYHQDFAMGPVRKWPVPDGTIGRTVRIRMLREYCLQLAEVEIMGFETTTAAPTPTLTNVAFRKPSWQSCNHMNYYSLLANDGDRNPDLEGRSVTHTCMMKDPWWMVDLMSNHLVVEVVVYNRQDCCSLRLREFDIEVLDENTDVVDSKYFEYIVEEKISIRFDHVRGRFVRIRLRNKDYLSMAEFEVYGYKANKKRDKCHAAE